MSDEKQVEPSASGGEPVYATEITGLLTSLDSSQLWEELRIPEQKWMRFVLGGRGEDDATQIWIVQNPPGEFVPRHHHNVHRLELVLKGSYTLDGEVREAGSLNVFPAGVDYGPVEFGPDGGTAIEIFSASTDLDPIFSGEVPDEVRLSLEGMGFVPVTGSTPVSARRSDQKSGG